MNMVTIQTASQNLAEIITRTIEDSDETAIVADDGAVILVSHTYWDSMQETLRLLRDKRSLKALLEGHQVRESGRPIEAVTVGEAFGDLQN